MARYIPSYFDIRELVYPEFYEANKARGELMFMAFDARALDTLDRLRAKYGPLTVNTWHLNGTRELSGLRPMDSDTGAALSQHKFGRAFDCLFRSTSPDTVRQELKEWDAKIMALPESQRREARRGHRFEFITRIEEFPGMSWFHFDTGNHDVVRSGVKIVGK